MDLKKQVEKDHYRFNRYMTKERWISLWHQLDEVDKLDPEKVLEVGPGPGLFNSVASTIGIYVETLDLDPELKPDYVASITDVPINDESYDVVVAFQVLEHMPYDISLKALGELVRVSRGYVLISLPDAQPAWTYHFHVPGVREFKFIVPNPFRKVPKLVDDPEHYWEINRPGYPLKKIINDFSKKISLVNTYRVIENPYHRFFLFSKSAVAK